MTDIRQTKIAATQPRQTEIIKGTDFTVIIISKYSKKLSTSQLCYVAKDMIETTIKLKGGE